MDADRKKKLKDLWRKSESEKMEASIPIPKPDLKALFDFLDRENPPACDHTLRETIQFLTERGIDPQKVVPWLRENGGYCDCEVIFNVEEKFGEMVGRKR